MSCMQIGLFLAPPEGRVQGSQSLRQLSLCHNHGRGKTLDTCGIYPYTRLLAGVMFLLMSPNLFL